MKKIKAYAVSHGHMDIEWYQPLTTYAEWFEKSVRILDRIAGSDPEYGSYTYDGAVFPLLYIGKNDKKLLEKIKRLAGKGKLKIGPFYTQFDEFLICGENIIKNCLWGDRRSRELNADPMKAGYLPDNFGHPAQLAQILNGFGIKILFFSRGMLDIGDDVREFVFRSPDGSEVAASNFSYAASFKIYENNDPVPSFPNILPFYGDQYLTYDYIEDISRHKDHEGLARQLIEGVKKNAAFYPSGIVPLFIGADHCPPQEGLPETLALANSMQDEIEFILADPEVLADELLKRSKELTVFEGDLIGCKFERLYFGSMTTRAYLKRRMYDGEQLLYNYALPLAATASLCGKETDSGLEEATELLLINSAHDSIHGSSLDSVHRENEYRYDRSAQLCAASIHRSLAHISGVLSGKEGYEEFLVYSPRDFDGWVSAWLFTDGKQIELVDSEGAPCEFSFAPRREPIRNSGGEPYYQPPVGNEFNELLFRTKLRAGEVKKFFYRRLSDAAPLPITSCGGIENEFYRLWVENGGLCLFDKESETNARGFLRVIEEADAGDSFDTCLPFGETASYSSDDFGFSDPRVTESDALKELETVCVMRVPMETVGDVRSDSLTDMPVKVTLRLWKGVRRVDINVKITNRSANHRVRALFCLPGTFDTVTAGETFCSEEFGIGRPPQTKWWKEPCAKELPLRDYVSSVVDGTRYTVASRALYAFEPLKDGVIAFTLFRSIGELMRVNIRTRKTCCMTGVPVEDAQCYRTMDFDFCLVTHGENESVFDIRRRIDPFIYPPAVHQVRYPRIKAGAGELLPFEFIGDRSFEISIFEKSFDGRFYVLRFYEVNGSRATAKLKLDRFSEAYLSDMNQNVVRKLEIVDGVLELDVLPCKIVTLLLR